MNILKLDQGYPRALFLVLYYSLYTTMILKKISNRILISMLFSTVKDANISANYLNHDLDIINRWAHKWKLELNPDPLKQATEVLFSCKNNAHNHPQIIFNGTVVTKVEEQKHLGLTLEPNYPLNNI